MNILPTLITAVVAVLVERWLPSIFLKPLLLDGLAIFVLVQLFRILARNAKLFFSESSRFELTGAPWWRLLQGVLSIWAIFFLCLWGLRWIDEQTLGFDEAHPARYSTFLHTGMLLAVATLAMGTGTVLKWWRKVELTPLRAGFLLYSLTLAFGTLLLLLPWCLNPNASIQLIDAFFISVSALAITGLSPVPFTETFSLAGQAVVLFLMQIGGLGIVTLSAGLAVLARRRLSLSQTIMGQELYDVPNIGEISGFILKVFLTTLIAEGIGAAWIYFSLPPEMPLRLFHAVFHSVSAFCNAGFSTFAPGMDIPGLFFMKLGVLILVLMGGIGFPTLFEFLPRIWRRGHRGTRALTPHSQLTLLVSGVLLVVGAVGIFLAEAFNEKSGGLWNALGNGIFYSVSSRTAGFNFTPVGQLGFGTQLLIIFLMIIGGSPISTAGGIKTTTAGVMVTAALSVIRGHKWIQFGRSEISPLVLQKCIAIVFFYFAAVFLTVLVLVAIEPLDPWALTFEVFSASSTTGLSLGITEKLSPLGKLLIIGLMISGRMGLVVMVYIGIGKVVPQRFRYPTERYYVG